MKPALLTAAAAVALGLAGPALAESYRDTSVAMTVDNGLDLDAYLGKWYEIARFPVSFEEGCVGVTAEYALRDDGKIRVLNTCREETLDGPVKTAEGVAEVVAPSRLEVSFVPALSFLPFLNGDYWVLEVNDAHTISVVGNPGGTSGWILARSPQISQDDLDAAVRVLADNGYDTSRLIKVQQPGD